MGVKEGQASQELDLYVIRKMEKLTASLFLNCVNVELVDI